MLTLERMLDIANEIHKDYLTECEKNFASEGSTACFAELSKLRLCQKILKEDFGYRYEFKRLVHGKQIPCEP